MSRWLVPVLLVIIFIVALWPGTVSLYELTGEEELPGQLRGLTHWLYSSIRPQPDQAADVSVTYSDVPSFGMNTFLQQEVLPEVRQESLQLLSDAGITYIRQQFKLK